MSSHKPFSVHRFLREHLNSALSTINLFPKNSPYTRSPEALDEDPRANYLYSHLSAPSLDAKWIVVEYEYIDATYLDEYVNFYARCFNDYPRKCKRVHFFSSIHSLRHLEESQPKKDEDDDLYIGFKNFLLELAISESDIGSTDHSTLSMSYLGFSVVRPLPEAFWGRTLLKHYDDKGNYKRHYPATFSHNINFFGIRLSIKSLPFQEQDSIVDACATVALWTSLGQAAKVFDIRAPHPSSITLNGTRTTKGRAIPSSGLSVLECCQAIRNAGLEAEVFDLVKSVDVPSPLGNWVSLIYAYVHAKIPVIVGLGRDPNRLDHAVAIAGYSIDNSALSVLKKNELQDRGSACLSGARIREFYAHDDQRGPFCHYYVNPKRQGWGARDSSLTEWPLGGAIPSGSLQLTYYPMVVLVPVYHKIRIKFTDVCDIVELIDSIFKELYSLARRRVALEWDVYLSNVEDFKKEAIGSLAEHPLIEDILLGQLPRFMWIAKCITGGQTAFHLVLDATAPNNSLIICNCWWHDVDLLIATCKGVGRFPLTVSPGQEHLKGLQQYLQEKATLEIDLRGVG